MSNQRALRISIALCTCNGEQYLSEQLYSLCAQTRLPDELVVCDDRSTDATWEILERFRKEAPFKTSIVVNDKNLGFIANFGKAIGLANGDVIALCDQDDVWLPEKLAQVNSVFAERTDVGLVFSDGEVVDESLQSLDTTLFEYARFTPDRRRRVHAGEAFDVLLDANVVTGAAMAFRAGVRDLALPIPEGTGRYHDSWIALIASAMTETAFLPDRLIRYRQHESQVTGVRQMDRAAVLDREHYRHHAEYLQLVDDRLATAEQTARVIDARGRLADRIAHVRARAEMPRTIAARLPSIARELVTGRYGRYSNGIRSVVRDLIGSS